MSKYEKLKSEIESIIEIAEKCPDPLKEKCFEILLNAYITDDKTPQEVDKSPTYVEHHQSNKEVQNDDIIQSDEPLPPEDEIKITIFHTVVRRFLESNNIDTKDINKLYYLESGKLMPLYEHLGTTRISDSQIRLALLTAFENGYSSNELEFSLEEVRERCKTFKCYDPANYMAIYKRNKGLFDNIEEKDIQIIKLSPDGKKELANTILSLSRGE